MIDTPKARFEQGGMNAMLGISARDWYALGCAFAPPLKDKGRVIIGARTILCTDVASFFTMDYAIMARPPDPTMAGDLIPILERLFAKYGKPKVGVLISPSVWASSASILADEDIKDRSEVLAQNQLSFEEMSLSEKELISKWLLAQGMRCEFDESKVLK